MAEEKKVNGTTEEQKTEEKAPKKTFKEKRAEFAAKYPTLTKIGKVTGKVVEYTLMAGGALLGVSMVHSVRSNRSKRAWQPLESGTGTNETDNS